MLGNGAFKLEQVQRRATWMGQWNEYYVREKLISRTAALPVEQRMPVHRSSLETEITSVAVRVWNGFMIEIE